MTVVAGFTSAGSMYAVVDADVRFLAELPVDTDDAVPFVLGVTGPDPGDCAVSCFPSRTM